MKFSNFKGVYDYYLSRSQKLVNDFDSPVVLKTDCYNEAEVHLLNHSIVKKVFGYKGMHLIDCNSDFIKAADKKIGERKNVVIMNGDIRFLPYKRDSFDLILDLSTIDHVPSSDLGLVFCGYNKVLKGDGVALIISWLSKKDEVQGDWKPENQYYHFVDYFESELKKRFVVLNKEELILEPNNADHFLVAYEVKND